MNRNVLQGPKLPATATTGEGVMEVELTGDDVDEDETPEQPESQAAPATEPAAAEHHEPPVATGDAGGEPSAQGQPDEAPADGQAGGEAPAEGEEGTPAQTGETQPAAEGEKEAKKAPPKKMISKELSDIVSLRSVPFKGFDAASTRMPLSWPCVLGPCPLPLYLPWALSFWHWRLWLSHVGLNAAIIVKSRSNIQAKRNLELQNFINISTVGARYKTTQRPHAKVVLYRDRGLIANVCHK